MRDNTSGERDDRRQGPGVLAKAGLLLDALAEHGELTPNALARLLEEPRSSVYRLLRSLQELGMVEHGFTRGTYRLGIKLFELGSAAIQQFDVRDAALPVMRELYERTEETLFLCVRRGYEAVCIERLDGRWVQAMFLQLGGTLALHIGAAPRLLLAYEPKEFWDEYLSRGELEAFTDRTPVDRAELRAELERLRETGLALSDGDVIHGIAAIGVPIFDHTGALCAALSISGPRPAILEERAEEITRLLVEAGEGISRRLGLPSAP